MRIDYEFTNAKNGGFGVLGKGIASALTDAGHTLTTQDPDIIFTYGMPNTFANARKRHPDKPLIFYTVWESSIYPRDWVNDMKKHKVDFLLTASEYTRKSIIREGWPEDKVAVWEHGIDSRWKYKKRRDDGVFTFLHYNAYEWRKGWDIVLMAFIQEFQPQEAVRLILKARERDLGNFVTEINKEDQPLDISNVEEILGHISDEAMVDMLERADVGVFPVHGEGWFLPATECVAQGIPVIMPKQMAMAQQWNAGCIDLEIEGYINVSPRYPGAMIQASVGDLQKKMRWCYNNEQECRKMGKKGSQEVFKRFNWPKIIKDLEGYLNLFIK